MIVVDEETLAAVEFLATFYREGWVKTVRRAVLTQAKHARAKQRAMKSPGPWGGKQRELRIHVNRRLEIAPSKGKS